MNKPPQFTREEKRAAWDWLKGLADAEQGAGPATVAIIEWTRLEEENRHLRAEVYE